MNTYCICYQLSPENGTSKTGLEAALERFEDHCQVFPGVWLVATNQTREEIQARLRSHLTKQDTLLVEQVADGKGWVGWLRPEVRRWLEAHLGEP